ncbi:MAG TPA: hypothetical protein VKR55_06255 [Bradyrhizobium sp.]|uniref:hypothetical protein n=1 Tax=Bradyrhizobium sp. TaxID=376 RepID=UPI002CAB991B|nr:hypothetical protein [Bradyrhizobium sp.]HLZ01740.1 hypothetical protein [Bradyrhizobium sp.]
MATLSTVDMKLIDSLFGMYGGYVLNFSNKTFASFFSRDIGIDIYDDAYAIHGTSKGKRLWAFLEVGQSSAVTKELHALWEIREAERIERGEEEKLPQARARLTVEDPRITASARSHGPRRCCHTSSASSGQLLAARSWY